MILFVGGLLAFINSLLLMYIRWDILALFIYLFSISLHDPLFLLLGV